MAHERTRSKARKRQAQRRLPSTVTARAAHNRKQDVRSKRRRRDTDEVDAVARIAATPRRLAKGGRARSDPNNRAKSRIYAPRVAEGKGGRPRSRRLRKRKAA